MSSTTIRFLKVGMAYFVLGAYKVDSCCGGGASIEATAKRDGVDVESLVKALNVAVQVTGGVCAHCGDPEIKEI
ncbi:MAG TPA: hypothetical protein VF819_09550 [Nitrospira sp.]